MTEPTPAPADDQEAPAMTSDLHARYAKAEALLKHNLKKLITSPRVTANWIGETDSFWYRNETGDRHAFVLVDAAAGTKRPAFDHDRLAEALAGVLGEKPDPKALPLADAEFRDGTVHVVVGRKEIAVSLDGYEATVVGEVRMDEATSPDGRWAVALREHNLWIRDITTGEERQLTTDGAEAYEYGVSTDAAAGRVLLEYLGLDTPPSVVWSPDSTRFVTHRLDQRELELMHLVRSVPLDGGRPKPMTYRYAVAGDEHIATSDFFVFDAATGTSVKARCAPVDASLVPAIDYGFVWWSEDQARVYWVSGDRGDHHVALHALDPDTGEVTVLAEERSDSQISLGPQQMDCNVRVLSNGDVLWWSQRSGWAHLYRYSTDGTVTTLTSGDWTVRHIVTVDEAARRVVFTAGGREPGSDPYLQQLCSVSLDGGQVTALTSDGLDHHAQPSPSGRFFVDVASRWDTPAVSVLRDRSGAVVLELERADATALYAAGWAPPERAVVKSADGETDLYCAIYRPHDFDPDRKYPVVEEIYPGPQISCAPLRFPLSGGPLTGAMFGGGGVFAALGFVAVVVDGRGSALRSKAFQDDARRSGDARFVDDHVSAVRQLAEARPWMDLDRVGIYGHSAGGYASTRAMLQEPDFYKVAVSSGGNHDNRINHAWWGEKYFGLKGDFDFDRQTNVALAGNLKGKLLLVHGEMDDNAVPHGTMRLVDALIKANKDFDLLILPNACHHMVPGSAYWNRRRWDYFVRHLMGETPPDYRIAEFPNPDFVLA
ncbi:S9 family peptidase [Streptomyces malaysiensis]|uniref:S9 family peptidase n=1 Tax=Streptomyces malaysiensis TaxID=92644 RepID=UPI003713F21C